MAMLVDVSHHNTDSGPIDWTRARAEIAGVYMKVTEGLTVVDPAWQRDYTGAGGQHIPRGAYHFADLKDPVREANHFADQVVQHTWELVPVLDIEAAGATAGWVVAFRSRFRARMTAAKRSAQFRVYSSVSLLTGSLNPSAWIDSSTTIWAARYAKAIGWDHPALRLWQNSSTADVPGFVGSVDTDQYMHGWTPAADLSGGIVTDPNALLNTQYSVDSQPKESVGRRIQRSEELIAAVDAEVDALPATLKTAIATALAGASTTGTPTGTYPVALTLGGATVATGSLVVGPKQATA